MSESYPHPPPFDAPEWRCPACGADSLWCGCEVPLITPVTGNPATEFKRTEMSAYPLPSPAKEPV